MVVVVVSLFRCVAMNCEVFEVVMSEFCIMDAFGICDFSIILRSGCVVICGDVHSSSIPYREFL